MPEHPRGRRDGGLDPESEKWWAELTRPQDDTAQPHRPPAPLSLPLPARRGLGSRRRRSRRRRTLGDPAYGGSVGSGRTSRSSKALALFVGLLVAVGGVISFVERGWEQTRIATLDAGGGVDRGTVIDGEEGQYAFIRTQPGTKNPVAYPACRAISVQVNSSGEVSGGTQIILDSLARVSDLSGLELRYTGPSSERPAARDARLEAEGYEAHPPVQVAWSDSEETAALAGDVVGVGGSVSVRGAGYAEEVYVTGSVILDSPDLAEVLDDHGEDTVRAVVMHELGPLLGLGHVGDPDELMAASNTGQTDFGAGDREGLARLGSGEC